MTDRIQRLCMRVKNARVPICTKKFQIASRVAYEYREASAFTRRSAIQAAILREMPVYIPEDELLVGEGASKPFGVELDYEFGMWQESELDDLGAERANCYVPEEDLEFCREYYRNPERATAKNLSSLFADYACADEKLWPVMKSGLMVRSWKSREHGIKTNVIGLTGMGMGPGYILTVPDYAGLLRKGARGIIEECRECLREADYSREDSLERIDYWRGVIEVFEAWIDYAHRYADEAARLAETERDETRKKELLEIEAVCRRVPEHPAGSFREALQMFWFTWILLPAPTNSAGRFDQYMYPYYKADIDAGKITDEEVLELLENLRTKSQAFTQINGAAVRGGTSGGATWYNYTIGGVDKDGNDATNALSYLLIEAARETQTPNHTLTLRVHKDTPPLLMRKALELVKTGLGMPAFISDDVYIDFFLKHGATLEEARDYVITGCLDGNLPGKTRLVAMKIITVPQILDFFLHNGFSRYSGEMVGPQTGDPCAFGNFEDFLAAYYKQMEYMLRRTADACCIEFITQGHNYSEPFRSAIMEDGVKAGKDIYLRQCKPYDNAVCIIMAGAINTADALTAIKKLIFEEKKYTMQQLLTALDANWEGYEEMRQDFAAAPKYGNDNDEADAMAADLYEKFAQQVEACKHPYGHCVAAGISVSAHQPGGLMTPASPEGRKAGEVLTDGSISPEHGCDLCGPLAVFRSGMKIDQSAYNATLLNMKLSPDMVRTESDIDKLGLAIRAYFANGGRHVQFNVVDQAELVDAKVNPEQHGDLIVRVAGYSAYFTRLTPIVQDEIIDRTTYEQL